MYHLDYETYSAADLRSVGAYRYAADPTARILLCAVSYGDNTPLVWDSLHPDTNESRAALRLIQEASTSSELVYAHNAPFEVAVSTYCWEKTFGCPPPVLERWRCTAAMCRRAAIPWSLAGAADFLGLDIKKDKAGSRLIQLFSVPQKGTPAMDDMVTVDGARMTRAEAWVMFREYCRRDVEVEREIHGRLKAFELTGTTLESFLFDLRMNDLGVPVDLPALRQARAVVQEYNEKLAVRFTELTGLAPSQTMAFTTWMKERGYGADDLQAATMEAWLERPELSEPAREALGIRAALSFAAVKKIDSMLECACPDARVRGAFMWYGAVRTGRWAGRLVQPQNIRRPTITDLDTCYDLVAGGAGLEALETMWDKPLEAVASVVRNFIRHEEHEFIDADFANIEGRVAGWLAGDEPLLADFRAGVDVYKVMAGSIYDVPPDEVNKSQRMTGKIAVLSCGYGTGWRRFQEMASAQGHPLDDEMSQLTVFKYRKARQPIVTTWRQFGDAAVCALRNPGEIYKAGEHVEFRYGRTGGFAALTMRLPSGRRLVYPHARVLTKEVTSDVLVENEDGSITTESRTFTAESVSFYGPKQATAQWGEIETHGSKLFENCVAGDAEVLTPRGWVRLDSISREPVWDGQEFVSHKGLTQIKKAVTMCFNGVWMTPEHRVLTSKGWEEAQTANQHDAIETCRRTILENERLHRDEVRYSDCYTTSPRQRKGESGVGLRMRVREAGHKDWQGIDQGKKLRPHVSKILPWENAFPQYEPPPRVCSVPEHVRSLSASYPPSVEKLRGQGDQGVRPLERIVPEILGGYGAVVRAWSYTRTERQYEGVFTNKLPVGPAQGAGSQHTQDAPYRYPVGSDVCERGQPSVWDRTYNAVLSACDGSAGGRTVRQTGCTEPVYDIINCGPRNRFVVRGAGGEIFIVHNCCQAVAGDFLTHGVLLAEKEGYQIPMVVHDQAIAYHRPDTGHTLDKFLALLTTVPEWAPGFPLKAEANVVRCYSK